MKPQDVADAIELAYESLKEDSPHWRNSERSGCEHAISWEELIVCSDVKGPRVERNGEWLVRDGDRNLVPTMSGSFPAQNRFSIYDDEKGARLIAKAENGDPVALSVLCLVAARFVQAGCVMPTRLRKFIADLLFSHVEPTRGSSQRGPAPYGKHNRNFYIACTILFIVKQGFKPTRNRATTKFESACSIVTKALPRIGVHLSEGAVEKIWAEFSEPFLEELNES